ISCLSIAGIGIGIKLPRLSLRRRRCLMRDSKEYYSINEGRTDSPIDKAAFEKSRRNFADAGWSNNTLESCRMFLEYYLGVSEDIELAKISVAHHPYWCDECGEKSAFKIP